MTNKTLEKIAETAKGAVKGAESMWQQGYWD